MPINLMPFNQEILFPDKKLLEIKKKPVENLATEEIKYLNDSIELSTKQQKAEKIVGYSLIGLIPTLGIFLLLNRWLKK